MSYLHMFRYLARLKGLGIVLLTATIGWAVGIPFLINTGSAAQLTFVSATASSSAPSVSTSYMVRFTTTGTLGSGVAGFASSTRITFDPVGDSFDVTSLATTTDVFISGGVTQVANLASCTGPTTDEVYVSQIGRSQPADFVEFTTCMGDTVPAGAKIVNLPNAHVTNPGATGSYVVRIGAGFTNATTTGIADSGDTRVAIISSVTMTASVDSNLTFAITGVASSSIVNGDTTSTSTTPSVTAIGFGTLSVGTSSIAAQDISVATNAANGFSVTVTQSQDLTASNGATINAFRDGNAAPAGVLAAPAAWGAAPLGTIGNANSYGHMGITSEDATLPADDFGSAFYGGLTSTSTRTVLYHTGPADGTTADIGRTRVGYRVQITSLQEAGSDYTNQIRYVCTPIF